jgi:hypothetical protein
VGELRSTKRVVITPAQTFVRPAQRTVEHSFFGPCLRCARDMQYDLRNPMGEHEAGEWLLKEFKRRRSHVNCLEGRRQSGPLSLNTLEGIVCPTCWQECSEIRDALVRAENERIWAQRAAENDKFEQGRRDFERWKYHNTWRTARPDEFQNAPDGSARFTVESTPDRVHEILFRWRATGGQCRGDSPRNVVGIWIDERFAFRYHAWNLAPFVGNRQVPKFWYQDEVWPPPEDSVRQDVFGLGFCQWLERRFQPELLRCKPAALWKAQNIGLQLASLSKLETPCVVHAEWIDGSLCANVLVHHDSSKVLEFAKCRLGITIKSSR